MINKFMVSVGGHTPEMPQHFLIVSGGGSWWSLLPQTHAETHIDTEYNAHIPVMYMCIQHWEG